MITREEMENIANLSKLYLSEDDFEKMSKEMDGIINFVNQINTLNDQYNLENNSNNLVILSISTSFTFMYALYHNTSPYIWRSQKIVCKIFY